MLEDEYNQTMATFSQKFEEMDWSSSKIYGDWLAQTYYYVTHSTRLIALSAAHCDLHEQAFHDRFLDHLREERNHEILAERDLTGLGFSLTDFPELPETSGFYQSQYYWIYHRSPHSFFGYALCLEGLAAAKGNKVYNKLKEIFGENSRFLKVHAQEDPDHLNHVLEHINKLSDINKQIVFENYRLCIGLYSAVLEKISLRSR